MSTRVGPTVTGESATCFCIIISLLTFFRGCVTPKQLQNMKAECNMDMDYVDGYEELPQDVQEKVYRALDQGHVDDEDWKGDPEYNRPGMSGNGPTKAAKAKKEAAEVTISVMTSHYILTN